MDYRVMYCEECNTEFPNRLSLYKTDCPKCGKAKLMRAWHFEDEEYGASGVRYNKTPKDYSNKELKW